MTITEKIEGFMEAENNFLLQIRNREEINLDNVKGFLALLKELEGELKNKQYVEKRIVWLLIDVVPAILIEMPYYQEKGKDYIEWIMAEVSEQMIMCFKEAGW